MRIVVTGSKELEYSVPFDAEAKQVMANILSKTGSHATAAQAGAAAVAGRAVARESVVREVHRQLDAIAQRQVEAGDPVTCLIHGGAAGVDRYAASWAARRHIESVVYKPNWMKGGVLDRQAGFKRNWYMLFREAGREVERDLQKRTGKLARKQAHIVKLIGRAKYMHSQRWLHVLVPLKVVLEDSRHVARRATLRRLGVAVPEGIMVVGFHDGESRGTDHCMMAAGQLGYMVFCHTYSKPEKPAIETGRIDHRPDDIDFIPLGSGRRAS